MRVGKFLVLILNFKGPAVAYGLLLCVLPTRIIDADISLFSQMTYTKPISQGPLLLLLLLQWQLLKVVHSAFPSLDSFAIISLPLTIISRYSSIFTTRTTRNIAMFILFPSVHNKILRNMFKKMILTTNCLITCKLPKPSCTFAQ